MEISTNMLYRNEVRTESNGSQSATELSTLIDSVSAIELTLSESIILEDALADGEAVPFLGYAFQRQYRRGQEVYNVCVIKRRRRAIED